MLERYATAASTYAHSIDHLFILIALIVGFWLIAAEGMMFALIFRFRAKDGRPTQYITGEEPHLKRWVSIPHYIIIVCDVIILAGAITVWYRIKQVMPPADVTVRVIGQQWAWSFQEPGPDGVLDTADDIRTVGELHVTVNTTYHFELLSRDVVHSFAVPAFRLKQDALPGRTISGWFRPNRVGTYDIQCTQMCGIGHALMAGRIIVETPKDHAAWLLRNPTPAVAERNERQAPPSPSMEGPATMAEVRR
jgi:cytochrome c oxidase subunit II